MVQENFDKEKFEEMNLRGEIIALVEKMKSFNEQMASMSEAEIESTKNAIKDLQDQMNRLSVRLGEVMSEKVEL